MTDDLSAALDVLARAVARHVVAELRSGETGDFVDQHRSPLGSRRHVAATRRRIAHGESGAAQVGRRFLLSREAVTEELEAVSTAPRRPRPERALSVGAELRAELGLARGAR